MSGRKEGKSNGRMEEKGREGRRICLELKRGQTEFILPSQSYLPLSGQRAFGFSEENVMLFVQVCGLFLLIFSPLGTTPEHL